MAFETLWGLHHSPRNLSVIDCSTAANDPQTICVVLGPRNPQCIPANIPPVFPGLRPRIWPHLLRLVTKAMSDRLLETRYSDHRLSKIHMLEKLFVARVAPDTFFSLIC